MHTHSSTYFPMGPWGKTGKESGGMHEIRRRRPSKVWAGLSDDGRPPGISGRAHFALGALPSSLGVTAAAYSRLKSISRGHEHGSLFLTKRSIILRPQPLVKASSAT